MACAITRCATLLLTLAAASAAAQARDLPLWRVDPTPLRTLAEDGRPETEFNRIAGAWRLSRDRIVVANAGSSELRVFGPDGSLERAIGRRGAGPGEFQFMLWAGRNADTVFVFDPALKRITWFDLAAAEPRPGTLQVTADGGRESLEVRGRLADGSWLAKSSSMVGWDSPPGVHRKLDGVGIVRAAGDARVRWIAEIPGMAGFVFNPTGDLKQAMLGPIAFSPWALAVTSAGTIWYGESGTPTVTRVDAQRRTHRVELPLEPRQPSRELIVATRAAEEQADPRGSRAFKDAKFSAQYLPRSLPFFEELIPVADGGIWVRSFVATHGAEAPHLVIDREGQLRARVVVPAGLRVTDVGRDHIVGVFRDEDGVESVRMHRLIRN